MALEEVVIDRRFNGPPDSGNGGYVCGLVGERIEGAASVRLLAPPPLDVSLALVARGEGLALTDGDRDVAIAKRAALDLDVPAPPTLSEAETATQGYRGFHDHVFPTCFVCGTERGESDGLRLFTGPVEGRDMVAAPWTPHSNLGGNAGVVLERYVWAALDCPGAFSFPQLEDGAVVLGELTAEMIAPVRAGEPHIAMAWYLGSEGRKHWAGSAVMTADGEVCAKARATWIAVSMPT